MPIVELLKQLYLDERGQDLVEYSLIAAFLAVATGAVLPPVADGISVLFSKMASVTENVALQ